ncbi:DNA-binding protein Alba [Candidatus Bathyarchaeota archaeon]|nr:DNA-binding protein Alba [Candidatus Bathyarchaeota archaeon]
MSENTVYIGSKPVLVYVTAIMTCFGRNPEEVVLKARGRSISTAVDAAEVTKNRYLSNLENKVTIGTEQMPGDAGGTRNVSTIEITLRKKAPRP